MNNCKNCKIQAECHDNNWCLADTENTNCPNREEVLKEIKKLYEEINRTKLSH